MKNLKMAYLTIQKCYLGYSKRYSKMDKNLDSQGLEESNNQNFQKFKI